MMTQRKSQREEILAFIEEHGSITHRQAEEEIGCTRLSARINELRKMGHKIKTDMQPSKNRHEKIVYHACYKKVV